MSDSDDPIYELVNNLPSTSVTGAVLRALDFVAPGQWKNITSFEELLQDETGESDDALIQQIGERAIVLYTDPAHAYQRAVWCFQLVDSLDQAIVAASTVNLIGQKFDLRFLKSITPQPETAQALDAGIKLACELASFAFVNGIPGESVAEFAKSLAGYAKDDLIRIAAFVAIDCVLPLGPNFVEKMTSAISGASLTDSRLFSSVAKYLPGNGLQGQKEVIRNTLQATGDQLTNLAKTKGIEQASLLDKLGQFMSFSDNKLDVIAASLDLMTNHYEHTGVQSVARRVISRAYSEI
ncbi:MAG: hypothetical protein ACOY0T_15150 [Myxococcota bacterium]